MKPMELMVQIHMKLDHLVPATAAIAIVVEVILVLAIAAVLDMLQILDIKMLENNLMEILHKMELMMLHMNHSLVLPTILT